MHPSSRLQSKCIDHHWFSILAGARFHKSYSAHSSVNKSAVIKKYIDHEVKVIRRKCSVKQDFEAQKGQWSLNDIKVSVVKWPVEQHFLTKCRFTVWHKTNLLPAGSFSSFFVNRFDHLEIGLTLSSSICIWLLE